MHRRTVRTEIFSALAVCLSVCGLTLLLLFAAYLVRGVWPFGTDNVAYVDTAQFYLPGYVRIWDALHGAPMYDSWTAGLAEGANASIGTFLWLPNLVFLLVPRDMVLEGLSLYLAAQLVLVAFGAGLAAHLRFRRLHPLWQVLLALVYTLSGFVLQYYSNFTWLWVAALFPLLLYALERLLRDGRYILYVVLYAWLVYESVYFAYMITAYIVLFSAAYVLFILPKELRGDRLFRLGVCTAAVFGLAAVGWLSSSASLAGTSRFQSNLESGVVKGVTTWDITATRHTTAMLLGTAPALALMLRALRRRRELSGEARARAGRTTGFFLLITALLAIPMVFTNIDTAWHFGQYNFFPMRYGFVVPATLLAAAGVILEHENEYAPALLPDAFDKKAAVRAVLAVPAAAALVWLEPRLAAYYRGYGTVFLTVLPAREYWLTYFTLFLGCGALFVVLYILLTGVGPKKLALGLTAAAILLQLFTNTAALIAPNDEHTSSREYDPAYVETADALYAWFSENEPGALSRAKNADASLSAGYPSIAGVSAVSSVAAGNSALRLGVYHELGYTTEYFRILDTGGTVLSDMMLGVDTILTAGEPDASLYEDTGVVVDGIRIGRARYPGAVGLTYSEEALADYLDETDMTARYNMLYRAFTGAAGEIAYTPALTLEAEGDGIVQYTLSIEAEDEAMVYLASDELLMLLSLDGERFTVPTYQNPGFVNYPAAFNSNLLYLGIYAGETAVLQFSAPAGLSTDDFTVVALRKALVERFREDAGAADTVVEGGVRGGSVEITIPAADAGKRLFLPLTYTDRWQITVNGRPVTAERALGVFVSVPLEAGENVVTVSKGPAGHVFGAGDLISLVSLALCAAWLILRRRLSVPVPAWAGAAAKWLFAAAAAAVFILLYIAPTAMLLLRGTIKTF